MAEDDDEAFGSSYEGGRWIWDENSNELNYVSDQPVKRERSSKSGLKLIAGSSAFKEIDVIEQLRFRKRYQRRLKPKEEDVITLQDVKDLAIYTAPLRLLSVQLINLLHIPTTERFIRALILYCHYFLQISEEMEFRMLELQTKVRTPLCEQLESEYSQNLSDLRVMVAKEYGTLIIGGDDTKKFHHMGPQKKSQSLSDKDAKLFETFVRMCIQIVWLTLGRRSFNVLEMEISRLFKSEAFNFIEHMLKTGYMANMSPEEHKVLMGQCLRHDMKLNTRSPLMNAAFCHRRIDYRMMGLGVIKYDELPPRLRYLLQAVAAPEADLLANNVTCGILGFPRSRFDTALQLLPDTEPDSERKTSVGSTQSTIASKSIMSKKAMATNSSKSTASVKKDKRKERKYAYDDLVLPPKEEGEPPFPPEFPERPDRVRPCNNEQRVRWQRRLDNLMNPTRAARLSIVNEL